MRIPGAILACVVTVLVAGVPVLVLTTSTPAAALGPSDPSDDGCRLLPGGCDGSGPGGGLSGGGSGTGGGGSYGGGSGSPKCPGGGSPVCVQCANASTCVASCYGGYFCNMQENGVSCGVTVNCSS